jgi:hypothetical protein
LVDSHTLTSLYVLLHLIVCAVRIKGELYKKHTMTLRISFPTFLCLLAVMVSCSKPETIEAQATPTILDPLKVVPKDPHEYGGWYCPDNFGFVPVDIQQLDQVPAITDRLPTEEELKNHMSLIKVDTEKYPNAKAYDLDLPRVGKIISRNKGISELVIVIQAISMDGDIVVGYRFPNGGNGSAWLSEVTLLSDEEVAAMGAQPFFYKKATIKASKEEIWKAICETEYAKGLGEKFDEQAFFSAAWDSEKQVHLSFDTREERAVGYVGLVFGNAYLHIDYARDGFHYSEKLLMMENHEDNTTELYFASGPFPEGFDQQETSWDKWFTEVVNGSQE